MQSALIVNRPSLKFEVTSHNIIVAIQPNKQVKKETEMSANENKATAIDAGVSAAGVGDDPPDNATTITSSGEQAKVSKKDMLLYFY